MIANLDRTKSPLAYSLSNINLIKAELKVLANGMNVYVIDGTEEDVIKLELVFPSGTRAESKALVASATNYLINAGTSTMSSSEIMEKIDFYGSYYQHDNQLDRSSLSLYSLKKYFPETLQVFAECVQDAIFPEEELTIYKQNSKQRFLINSAKNDFRARREFHAALFPNHPYGRKVEISDFDQLNREDLITYYKEHYDLSRAYILLTGKVDENDLKCLESSFYSYKPKALTKLQFNTVTENTPQNIYEERPDALQSAIRIGKKVVTKKHADYIELTILSTVLGGYFGSRLMANIREDKGYTYGIGAGIYPLLDTSFFYIATEVGVEVTQSALDEIYKEIVRLSTELIPEEELILVKNYLKGAYIGSIENIFSHADKFRSIRLYDMDYDYYDRYFKLVDEVSSERLLHLAKEYFQRNTLTEVVIGKK